MSISVQTVKYAYLKLKQSIYFDKNNLFLRQRLSEFESRYYTELEAKFSEIAFVLNSRDISNHTLTYWLDQIKYKILPKSIEHQHSNKNCFSNVVTSNEYETNKVNYYFDGPIELHIISTIWIINQGYLLDMVLSKDCYGVRLDSKAHNILCKSLFKKYHEQYSSWRDNGIKKADKVLKEDKSSIFILGLDIKQYFYSIRMDYAILRTELGNLAEENSIDIDINLLKIIENITRKYRDIINTSLGFTHDNIDNDSTLPIGINFSPILANWYLKDIDKEIIKKLNPAYYGRYVDDILLVISTPDIENEISKEEIINEYFIKRNILSEVRDKNIGGNHNDKEYCFVNRDNLILQSSKSILQYFDRNHSTASLHKFKKKIEDNSSDFQYLPEEEFDGSLEEVAYDLLYNGSVNKFRSITGIVENKFELAKYLARIIILQQLTDENPTREDIKKDIMLFFKGRNALEYYDMWERVFSYFVIINDYQSYEEFDKQLSSEIKKIKFINTSRNLIDLRITNELWTSLEENKINCMSMALTLRNRSPYRDLNHNIVNLAENYLKANMLRHHYVPLPLLNYSGYIGDLAECLENLNSINSDVYELISQKIEYNPRYVHFHEIMMYFIARNPGLNKEEFDILKERYESLNDSEFEGVKYEI